MIAVIKFVLIICCMSSVMLFYAFDFCYTENAVMLLFDTTHSSKLSSALWFR